MVSNEIKVEREYINTRNGRAIVVEDYFEGLVVYHYKDRPDVTRQMHEQWFCINMICEKDVRQQAQ